MPTSGLGIARRAIIDLTWPTSGFENSIPSTTLDARTASSGARCRPTPGLRPSRISDSNGQRSKGPMTKDFEELFACLRHRNVKALVVGGYAVAFRE